MDAEPVLVPMRVCRREEFEKVGSGMFYDMQVMALGSMEALVCPDYDGHELLGNLMLPMYEVVQFVMTDCDGDTCGDATEKADFLPRFQTYMFMVNSQIDFSKYGLENKPITSTCKKIFTVTPYETWSIETNLYMMVNQINIQDDWF